MSDVSESLEALKHRIAELEARLAAARYDQYALKALCQAVPQRVFWKDRDSRWLGGNAKLASDVGVGQDKLQGIRDHDLFPKEQADFFVSCDREVMAKGEPLLDIEEPQARPDGSTAWLLTSKVPLRDGDEQVVGMLGTYMDVTEQKETAQKLEDALVRVKVSEAKSTLLTTISHELRTPLTLILAPLADLLGRDDLPAAVADELAVVERNALRLKGLVDDVLDLQKVNAGRATATMVSVDLSVAVAELVSDATSAARVRGC